MPIEPKDIATLWMQENAIVNQKTNYYVASMAMLAWPTVTLWLNDRSMLAAYIALLGAVASVISFISIARTAAYRDHWRTELGKASEQYREMFEQVQFKWYQTLSSNGTLIATPLFGLIVWLVVIACLLQAM